MYLLSAYVNMYVYFETDHRNSLIYILTYIEVKSNKIFNSRDWVAIISLISNNTDQNQP